MKTLILFYSLSGNTKAFAEKKARELGADIEEILEEKKASMISVWVFGVSRALKRQTVPIKPIKSQISSYDTIIIMSPVWAGKPTPAINSVFALLPPGAKVEIIMVSAGGGTPKSSGGTKTLLTTRGCEVIGYTDVKVKRDQNGIAVQELD